MGPSKKHGLKLLSAQPVEMMGLKKITLFLISMAIAISCSELRAEFSNCLGTEKVAGATLDGGKLLVRFPAGEGYQRTAVRFTW